MRCVGFELQTLEMEKTPLVQHSSKARGSYDSTGTSSPGRQNASTTSEASYTSSCDMRKLFDVEGRVWAGSAIAFCLIFTSWTAWHALTMWWAELAGHETLETVSWFLLIVNASALAGTMGVVLVLRFLIGPVLDGAWRAVLAGCLFMLAICAWELLENGITLIIGRSAQGEFAFYFLCFLGTVAVSTIFERVYKYDVVGNHLITAN